MSLHIEANKNEIAKTVLMPGDPLRARYIAQNFLTDTIEYNNIRGMLGFTGLYKGEKISVQGSGMGMPSMGIYSWELFNDYDVDNIIRIGTAGSMNKKLDLGDIVVATGASTNSNYIQSFGIDFGYSPIASPELILKADKISKELNIDINMGNIFSGDVFYESNSDWWHKWSDLNVLAVDMEAAALYINAAKSKKNALAVLTISDNFHTGERASKQDREQGFNKTMELVLNIGIDI